jgi:hypothetical protein
LAPALENLVGRLPNREPSSASPGKAEADGTGFSPGFVDNGINSSSFCLI